MTLREKLLKENKTKWLDLFNGSVFDEGFLYLDIYAENFVPENLKDRYTRLDFLTALEEKIEELGTFDLVRMQHGLEHFSFEEGLIVLKRVAKILNPGGVLLISVPDLKINIQKYLDNTYKDWGGYKEWAQSRIPENAPASFYFSVFSHSMAFEPHKWCYDYEGLEFIVNLTDEFTDVKELMLTDPLAVTPFTHNRPEEDVCLIAYKK